MSGNGGAIYVNTIDKRPVRVIDCEFIDNTVEEGGSIYIRTVTEVDIRGCTF